MDWFGEDDIRAVIRRLYIIDEIWQSLLLRNLLQKMSRRRPWLLEVSQDIIASQIHLGDYETEPIYIHNGHLISVKNVSGFDSEDQEKKNHREPSHYAMLLLTLDIHSRFWGFVSEKIYDGSLIKRSDILDRSLIDEVNITRTISPDMEKRVNVIGSIVSCLIESLYECLSWCDYLTTVVYLSVSVRLIYLFR